jgi:metallo-beta-lactamase class B
MSNKMMFAAAALAIAVGPQFTPDNQPIEAFRIADRLFYVGSSDIASYLIQTDEGHILIDGGYPETAGQIEPNVVKIGLRLRDIKILLNTQAHFDHAGGFAEIKRITGAKLMVTDADAIMIERGGHGDFILGDTGTFPPVTVDRRLKDGETVQLGGTVLTAHLTPGHTKGCTTWTWDVRDRGRAYHVVDLCGLTILPGTNVSGMPTYPEIARDYARTYDVLKSLACDIFLGAHASYYGGSEKAARMRERPDAPNAFVDAAGYRTYVDRAERRFREQLARERQIQPQS